MRQLLQLSWIAVADSDKFARASGTAPKQRNRVLKRPLRLLAVADVAD